MRLRNLNIVFAAAVLVASLALYGCPKKPEVTAGQGSGVGPTTATAPGGPGQAGGTQAGETPVVRPPAPSESGVKPAPGGSQGGAAAASPLKDAFFDYDKSAVRDDQKAVLNEDASWLKANAGTKVLVEGHCDERGTAEYNLGLGERRAKAVKDYLIAAGIPADRISTISYGKERPFVLGHDESAWKWNRRGHFTVQGR